MIGRKPNNIPFVFHLTEQGESHKKNGVVCQDYSLKYESSKESGGYSIIAVADGHGSTKYFRSDRGSKLVCEAAIAAIKQWFEINKDNKVDKLFKASHETREEVINQIKKSIITIWFENITKDYDENPFTPEEKNKLTEKEKKIYENDDSKFIKAYGTTLIVVLQHSKFWLGLHIGDGKCVIYKKNKQLEQPIPWDERCFLNVTTSMSDENALGRLRHYYSEDMPDAIYIATDGVDDSYSSDERLRSFYDKLTESFRSGDKRVTENELKSFLPILSKQGSGDDISIAGIINF